MVERLKSLMVYTKDNKLLDRSRFLELISIDGSAIGPDENDLISRLDKADTNTSRSSRKLDEVPPTLTSRTNLKQTSLSWMNR